MDWLERNQDKFSMSEENPYTKRLMSRSAPAATSESPTPESKPDYSKMGQAMASSNSQTPEGLAGDALMMSGNPYAMAGGLGLKVLAQGEASKRQAYTDMIARRQNSINQLIQVAQSSRL